MTKTSREAKSIAKKLVNERPPTHILRALPNNPARGKQVAGGGLNKTNTYKLPAIKKKKKLK